MENHKPLTILIAEDDDGHAELITEGLKDAGVMNDILRFSNGQEIWCFLEKISTNETWAQNRSYLLLLDINMPKLDGIEVLRRIKHTDSLKEIPVIMLTTTDDPREVEHCYQLGCNIYITKPVNFTKFSETLNRLGLFIQIIKV